MLPGLHHGTHSWTQRGSRARVSVGEGSLWAPPTLQWTSKLQAKGHWHFLRMAHICRTHTLWSPAQRDQTHHTMAPPPDGNQLSAHELENPFAEAPGALSFTALVSVLDPK